MNVSVFGLGYVGSVSAASFAADGHTVIGVDVNPGKVATLNEGRSPIVEKGLDELIRENAASGHLRATTSTAEAVNATDLSLICVGTPSRKNGSLDLTYLERVAEQIGEALRSKERYHVVCIRSTVLPGTTHEVVIPALERTSGKKYGVGFGVTINPEFCIVSVVGSYQATTTARMRSQPRRCTRTFRRRWSPRRFGPRR